MHTNISTEITTDEGARAFEEGRSGVFAYMLQEKKDRQHHSSCDDLTPKAHQFSAIAASRKIIETRC